MHAALELRKSAICIDFVHARTVCTIRIQKQCVDLWIRISRAKSRPHGLYSRRTNSTNWPMWRVNGTEKKIFNLNLKEVKSLKTFWFALHGHGIAQNDPTITRLPVCWFRRADRGDSIPVNKEGHYCGYYFGHTAELRVCIVTSPHVHC